LRRWFMLSLRATKNLWRFWQLAMDRSDDSISGTALDFIDETRNKKYLWKHHSRSRQGPGNSSSAIKWRTPSLMVTMRSPQSRHLCLSAQAQQTRGTDQSIAAYHWKTMGPATIVRCLRDSCAENTARLLKITIGPPSKWAPKPPPI
jgi:hypothetical protein